MAHGDECLLPLVTCRQLFGEGLNWSGCCLIVLLNQQRRFESLDFSYHLLRVNRVDQQDETCKGIVSTVLAVCEYRASSV